MSPGATSRPIGNHCDKEPRAMFDVYCPSHDSRVLLGPRSIEAIVNTPNGVQLRWRCRCGATGTLRTGRPAHAHDVAGPVIESAA